MPTSPTKFIFISLILSFLTWMVSERYRCAYSDHEHDEEDFVCDEEDSIGDKDLEASASESSCSSTS